MVGCRVPSALSELYPVEFLQRRATPVCRRSRHFQSAFTFSTILVTQHPKLSLSISPQPMGTKQPRQPFIDSLDRAFARYRRPDQLINVLNRLNLRSDDTHSPFRLAERALVLANSTNNDIYNTVILVWFTSSRFQEPPPQSDSIAGK